MSAMTQWSIGLDRTVTDADRDEDGYVKAEVLGRWLTEAVDAYLAQCHELHRQVEGAEGYSLVRRPSRQPRSSLLGRPAEVLVTASATEIKPTEFYITVRVRPFGGDEDLPINVTCRVSIEDSVTGEPMELGSAVRDEIVAIEREAEYLS
jgi:acyl-CoA thioesterase FadM